MTATRQNNQEKESKSLPYIPPKIKAKGLFVRLDERAIARIENELKDPKDPKVIEYIKTRLNGNVYGRYSKKVFGYPYGFIHGNNGLYVIYNENNHQVEAAAEGAFGKIKLAKNVRNNEWVIVKTQEVEKNNETSQNQIRLDNYRNEHRILSKLDLTKEPEMYRRSKKNKKLLKAYSVMKYLKGQDLFEFIASKIDRDHPMYHWSDLFWLHVCIRITEAIMQKVHQHSVLHCDIKFENILFDMANDEANIVDFGNAKELIGYAIKPRSLCIAGYNAPENFHGIYSEKSEMFAFSNLLEAFLCNNIPHASFPEKLKYLSITSEPRFEHARKKNIFINDLEITTFLKKMRDPDPTQRPAFAELLQFLKNTFKKYAADDYYADDVRAVQQILREANMEENIRLKKIHKEIEQQTKTEIAVASKKGFFSCTRTPSESPQDQAEDSMEFDSMELDSLNDLAYQQIKPVFY